MSDKKTITIERAEANVTLLIDGNHHGQITEWLNGEGYDVHMTTASGLPDVRISLAYEDASRLKQLLNLL